MIKEEIKFSITTYNSIDELNESDAMLLREARNVTQFAYAPYSNFHVGAFAKLENGKIISGTNQENASFPQVFAQNVLCFQLQHLYFPA